MQTQNIIFTNSKLFGSLHTDLAHTFLEKLNVFSKKQNISLYFLTELREQQASSFLNQNKIINNFFLKENIINISNDYLLSLSEIDIELRQQKYELNEFYIDSYFKIYFIKNNPTFNSLNTLVIAQDIWSDAYYLTQYTASRVLLLKPFLSFNSEKFNSSLKSLPCIDLDFKDLKKHLQKKEKDNYDVLRSFAKNYLFNKTISSLDLNIDFSKLYKKK